MKRIELKTHTKGYFVPLLEKNFHFCDQQGHQKMALAMGYNHRDESGEFPISKIGNQYDRSGYISPVAGPGEKYKGEPHFAWRVYDIAGCERESGIKIQSDSERGGEIKLFHYITGTLIKDVSDEGGYIGLGGMRQLEDMVPHEYEFLIPMRDKLFPNLTDRERHYMNDHAKHDVEYHAKDIREGFEAMNLSVEQVQQVKEGMYLLYLARAALYSGFEEQIKQQEKNEQEQVKVDKINDWGKTIIFLPTLKKAIAASVTIALIGRGLESKNNKIEKDSRAKYEGNIELFTDLYAKRIGVYEEYKLGRIDETTKKRITREGLRMALIQRSNYDIGEPYLE